MRNTNWIAVMLLVVAAATAGCGQRAPDRADSPAGVSPTSLQPVGTPGPTTSEPMAVPAPRGPATTTATQPVVDAGSDVDDVEALLGDLDQSLAELDQLLNQAAAVMAAEKGEILP